MYVSKDWKKADIIEWLKKGKTNEEIKATYPSISTATLTSYRKKIVKENEIAEMRLKVDYATRVIPDHLDLEAYLKGMWDDFVRKMFPLIDKIDEKINERIESNDISTKDLILYKINLLNLLSKGNK